MDPSGSLSTREVADPFSSSKRIPTMSATELETLDRFHEELLAMAAAGIDVDWGMTDPKLPLREMLGRFRGLIARRVGGGATLEEALLDESTLPPRYRAAAFGWSKFENPVALLDSLADSPGDDAELLRAVRVALFRLSLFLALVAAAFAFSAWWLSPKLAESFAQLGVPLPAPTKWLLAFYHAVGDVFLPLIVLMLLIAAFARFGRVRWFGRLASIFPGINRRERLLRQACYAEYVAEGLRHGMPQASVEPLAEAFVGGLSVRAAGPYARSAPLLAWGLDGDLGDEATSDSRRSSVLLAIADSYRKLANRYVTTWGIAIPRLAAILIGGAALLAYGLMIFGSLFELLRAVSVPGVN
jgi:hypothetical protein